MAEWRTWSASTTRAPGLSAKAKPFSPLPLPSSLVPRPSSLVPRPSSLVPRPASRRQTQTRFRPPALAR
ncbi:MAG: hypothetical protein DMD72_02130 [Gemmatimonadetes bacterium]|nr:MAG: hypothetical protein DMD72_02130 [Gemmatimonadota bacterium]